ncbi:ComC/BlpC family leader-containing pheromone/bacteriocin [Streptococcus pluranimalium]
MTTQTISPFELLDTESLAAVKGGKMISYGLTGCKTIWHSGGIA